MDPVEEHRALFLRDGERFVPTELTRGPWDPNAMHGGAPSALFASVLAHHDPGPASFVARLTVELLRPVPLVPVHLLARTFRPGRKVQWLESVLLDADGTELARATALRMRIAEVDLGGPAMPDVVARPPPPAGDVVAWYATDQVGFWDAHDVHFADGGGPGVPGPAAAWFRLRCAVIDDDPVAPFERVAACADFGSGIGNPLTFATASAINAEVTIHAHRHPATEWVCLDAGAFVQGHGVGLAETQIFDEHGVIGRAAQAMLVQPVPRAD